MFAACAQRVPDDASNDLDVEREVETLLGAVADADGCVDHNDAGSTRASRRTYAR